MGRISSAPQGLEDFVATLRDEVGKVGETWLSIHS